MHPQLGFTKYEDGRVVTVNGATTEVTTDATGQAKAELPVGSPSTVLPRALLRQGPSNSAASLHVLQQQWSWPYHRLKPACPLMLLAGQPSIKARLAAWNGTLVRVETSATIFLKAVLVFAVAHLDFLTVANYLQPVGSDAAGDQSVTCCLRAPLTQCKVVFSAATLVGIPAHHDTKVRVRREILRCLANGFPGVRPKFRAVVVEVGIRHAVSVGCHY